MEKLKILFKEEGNIVDYKTLLDHGYSKYDIRKLVQNGEIVRIYRGRYRMFDFVNDEFSTIQNNQQYFIYSNETALYLHKLTDVNLNSKSVTTIQGYHLRNSDLKIYYVNKDVYKLGMITMDVENGSPIRVYDKERTICDLIKNKNRVDEQLYYEGLRNYFLKGVPNVKKLNEYAYKLKITSKMNDIIQLYR